MARQALEAPSVSPGLKLNAHPHLMPRLRRDKLKTISILRVVLMDNCNLQKKNCFKESAFFQKSIAKHHVGSLY